MTEQPTRWGIVPDPDRPGRWLRRVSASSEQPDQREPRAESADPGQPSEHGARHAAPEFGHNTGTAQSQPRATAGAGKAARHAPCPVEPRLLGLAEAATYLGLSDWTVRRLLWLGELPFLEIGRANSRRPRRLMDVRDLDAWIESRKQRHSLPAAPTPRGRRPGKERSA